MAQIILSIVSAGARKGRQFAFQVHKKERLQSIDAERLSITINNQTFEVTEGLKSYKRWGRITHPDIHLWITQNRLHRTPPRNPAKLIFDLSIVRKRHAIKLYPYQANLINS